MALPPEVLRKVRANLDEAERHLKLLEESVADAKLGGVPFGDREQEAKSLRKQIQQMRAVYGR